MLDCHPTPLPPQCAKKAPQLYSHRKRLNVDENFIGSWTRFWVRGALAWRSYCPQLGGKGVSGASLPGSWLGLLRNTLACCARAGELPAAAPPPGPCAVSVPRQLQDQRGCQEQGPAAHQQH